jgi:hypothetical protein
MPILRRDDGLQFIIQPYREILNVERVGVLKKKIRMLASDYGGNLCIFQTPDRNLEIVFSRDSGPLLGESVWNYLKRPNNLIYCEALFERNRALMVIVKNGVILLDASISYSAVMEELASLDTVNQKYDIYVYGDVPLVKSKSEGDREGVALEDQCVRSFNKLDESLFMKLPVYDEARLQPLELALNSPYLGKSYKAFLVQPIREQIAAVQKATDPFLGFYSSLTRPYPEDQLVEFASMEKLLMSLPPGWDSGKISFDGNKYDMEVIFAGGSMAMIREWMGKNHFEFPFATDKMPITVMSKLQPRPAVKIIYSIDDTLTVLIDKTNVILGEDGKVEYGGMVDNGSYHEANLNIHVNNVFVGILFLIGNELNKLPATIYAMDMKIKDGLYTGDIKIKVFGD